MIEGKLVAAEEGVIDATEEGAFAISQKKGRSHRPSRIDRFIFSPPLIDEKTPIRARVNPAR